MTTLNMEVYIPIVILMAFAVIMLFGALLVGRFLRPNEPTELKSTEYECGEMPSGIAWSNFNVRFYIVSLIFIIFDVEAALLFPVASIFKDFIHIGQGATVLVSFVVFVVILSLGVIYCWSKGDFEWVRSFQLSNGLNEINTTMPNINNLNGGKNE